MVTQNECSSLRRLAFSILSASFFGLPCGAQQPGQPSAGGVAASEPKYRLTRSVSGTKGTQQGGRYVIEDPRSIFYLPEDKQVIVYFEWDGPTGAHHFEGLWKNPDGKVVVYSDFKFEAKDKRFAAYWTMFLTPQLPTGMWALEARVDGEAAGTHTFQILTAARPAEAIGPPPRRTLTAAELYQKALNATVFIEKLGKKGEKLGIGSGFILAAGEVVTAFQVIDGASGLRAVLPDGMRLSANEVLAWNRKEDWAVLRVAGVAARELQRARPDSWNIGDRCFGLDSPSEINRVIVEGTIIGKQTAPGTSEQINVGMSLSPVSIGSPLLDEYGDVIAVVGGTPLPGAESVRGSSSVYSAHSLGLGGFAHGGFAVPITRVAAPSENAAPTTLEEMRRTGQFVIPLTAARHVLYGVLARKIDSKGPVPRSVDERNEFSKRDGQIGLLVTWEPKDKIKTTITGRFYDVDNRLLGETKPSKISLDPNRPTFTTLQVPIVDFKPGIYRIDLLLGDEPAWRAFFRVTE